MPSRHFACVLLSLTLILLLLPTSSTHVRGAQAGEHTERTRHDVPLSSHDARHSPAFASPSSAGVLLNSAALLSALHSRDSHTHAKRSAQEHEEAATVRTMSTARAGRRLTATDVDDSKPSLGVHFIQLQAGALFLSHHMLLAAHRANASATDSVRLQRAWARKHRMHTMARAAATGGADAESSASQLPRAPHLVFDHAFFHTLHERDTEDHDDEEDENEAAGASRSFHRPHLHTHVPLHLPPDAEAWDGDTASLHLHVPSAHTLATMRAYFRADGEESEARLAGLYAAQSGDEALASHPQFHYQWLLHLKSPVTPEVLARVERIIAPYKLGHYVPHSSYIVSLPYHVALRLQEGTAQTDAEGVRKHTNDTHGFDRRVVPFAAEEQSSTDSSSVAAAADSAAESSDDGDTPLARSSVLFVSMLHPAFKVQRHWPQLLATKLHAQRSRHEQARMRAEEAGAEPDRIDSDTSPPREHSHELRVAFTFPTFAPAGTGSPLAAQFPTWRGSQRLVRAFARQQSARWNRDPRFLAAMELAGAPNKRIEFRVVDSHQLVVRLPHELPIRGHDTTEGQVDEENAETADDDFLSFFVSELSAHPHVQHVEAHARHAPLNKYARLVVQADSESGDSCVDALVAQDHTLGGAMSVGEADAAAAVLDLRASAYGVSRRSSASRASQAPFTSLLGLDGRGQLLSIGDTGVDYDSCFFYDAYHPVAINPSSPDTGHRKIAGYITGHTSDAMNSPRAAPGDMEGHGTHTAGSLCGSLSPDGGSSSSFPPGHRIDNFTRAALAEYDGVAPAARVVIFDFQNPGDGALLVPNDVVGEFLGVASSLFGARISSNSWGDESGIYDSYARDIDDFLWRHPEFLMLMAAGNDGARGARSLATPAVAKNILTVGASKNGVCSFFERGGASGIQVLEPLSAKGTYAVTQASFGGGFDYRNSAAHQMEVCMANPPTACVALTNAAECAGKLVLVEREPHAEGCFFDVKALHVQQAGGAVMALLLHGVGERGFIMDADPGATTAHEPISIPCITLEPEPLAAMRSMLSAPGGGGGGGGGGSASALASMRLSLPVYFPTRALSPSALSGFSGKGPTQDGRIKPDILAPGEFITSAKSDNNLGSFQCSAAMRPPRAGALPGARRSINSEAALRTLEGTSMACPIAAGTAALVRQYFLEGHWVDPTTGTSTPLDPSSSLLKAILVSGTVPLSAPVEAPPSYQQGFGRVELAESLSYDVGAGEGHAAQKGKYDLFLKDQIEIETGEVHHYCFRARASAGVTAAAASEFKATLVWNDAPPVLPAVLFLVNDLDLVVVEHAATTAAGTTPDPAHRVFIGNERLHPSTPAQLQFDVSNNVEKVVVEAPTPGALYSVRVIGAHVPASGPPASDASAPAPRGQKYSLVVNGAFEVQGGEAGAECPAEVFCPNDCSGHGVCVEVPSTVRSGSSSSAAHTLTPSSGRCRCDAHWAGASCDLEATLILPPSSTSTSGSLTLQVSSDQWRYVAYDVRQGDTSLVWRVSRLTQAGGNGDPDFYFTLPVAPQSLDTFPTLRHFDLSNTECDSCDDFQRRSAERKVHQLTMHAADIFRPEDTEKRGGGTVMLGIWGYCCEGSQVEIELRVQRN